MAVARERKTSVPESLKTRGSREALGSELNSHLLVRSSSRATASMMWLFAVLPPSAAFGRRRREKSALFPRVRRRRPHASQRCFVRASSEPGKAARCRRTLQIRIACIIGVYNLEKWAENAVRSGPLKMGLGERSAHESSRARTHPRFGLAAASVRRRPAAAAAWPRKPAPATERRPFCLSISFSFVCGRGSGASARGGQLRSSDAGSQSSPCGDTRSLAPGKHLLCQRVAAAAANCAAATTSSRSSPRDIHFAHLYEQTCVRDVDDDDTKGSRTRDKELSLSRAAAAGQSVRLLA
jgi:hypothetical protein